MYGYIKGTVKEVSSNYITIDNNGIGYIVYSPNPYSFNIDSEYIVYTYQYVKEDEISLYGFKKIEEKNLFLKLISVKGVGCKMALPMIAAGSISGIEDAIERENILYLKKFPKIGDKVARQIVLDLKGKFEKHDDIVDVLDNDDLKDTLLALGYKKADVNKVVNKVNLNKSIEEQIKEALKLLLK